MFDYSKQELVFRYLNALQQSGKILEAPKCLRECFKVSEREAAELIKQWKDEQEKRGFQNYFKIVLDELPNRDYT